MLCVALIIELNSTWTASIQSTIITSVQIEMEMKVLGCQN